MRGFNRVVQETALPLFFFSVFLFFVKKDKSFSSEHFFGDNLVSQDPVSFGG
jgi:hypothetical protein